MSLVSGAIADVVEWVLGGALRAITGWLDARAEQKQGAVAQASRDTSVAEKVEAAMAQAEADAPKTENEALDRLRGGTA